MDLMMPGARVDFDRAVKPFALPLGLASPMWMAYGAAATLGATWWWMSRMTRLATPLAEQTVTTAAPRMDTPPAPVAAPAVVEALAALGAPVPAAPLLDALPASVAVETAIEQPDELTLLRGVGPRVADALVARGVTTFAQLAAWTEQEMAAFDVELKLLGRSKRYDFLAQARELARQDV